MRPARLDLTILQGARYQGTFLITKDASASVNLTGYEARLYARLFIDDTSTVFTWVSTGKVTNEFTMGGASGTIAVDVDALVTAGYDFDTAVYDMEVYNLAGVVYRLLEGTVKLSREVTR